MKTSRGLRPALLIATGTLLTALAAACGNSSHHAASGSPATPSKTASTPTSAARTTPAPSAQDNGPSGIRAGTTTPECKAADLKLSLGEGEGGAAGSFYPALQFTNSGSSNCAIVGFPGVSYVGGDDGHQVGAAAARSGDIGAQVTLAPGQVASAIVREVDAENYPAATCKPVAVRGFRVYAPDDTAALFLPFRGATKACSTNIGQLSVQTIKSGTGAE